MTVRVALLTELLDAPQVALWQALSKCPRIVEVRTFRVGTQSCLTANEDGVGGPAKHQNAKLGVWLQLLAYGPDLVVCDDLGWPATQAALYRCLSRRSRLLLFAREPARQISLRRRMVLAIADGVLADGDAAHESLAELPVPDLRGFPLIGPDELEPFAACAPTRADAAARRIVYAGDLSPRSGAADFLIALALWAEQHPDQPVEMWWIGEGDLAGVLGAQPLPATMSQRFLGALDRRETAEAFGQCGLLVVPSLTDDQRPLLDEALAAGLPVLGSRRSRKIRQLVREDVTGWLFDPLRGGDMHEALCRALATPAEQLDQMRARARCLASPSASWDFTERVRRAVAAILPDKLPKPVRSRVHGPVSDVG